MKDVELRRRVPVATMALIGVSLLGIFQLVMLAGGYRLPASTVKKTVPWLYDSFRRFVGEHPDTRPDSVSRSGESGGNPALEAVSGINPEELSVTLEAAEPVEIKPVEDVQPELPVSEPEKEDLLDSDEPVG
ncbi:hypothetical protein [Pontiella agarivorans]|uniref:Uncharacterized protein n=1 Tax=Pontiella agarivorans TaxID=3038953 RepID=A0ABU5MTG8_9BACT|nr:hypothetical protein [Pontiella agarivorans]MDZ8117505.1 hypothetical protein [Pontiella agarivorans]